MSKEDEKKKQWMRDYMRMRREDPSFRAKERKTTKARSSAIKEWFYDYKKILSCEKCGEDRHYVLEFHHTKGDKEKEISKMVHTAYSKKTILNELKKCSVLCANCHKALHHKRRNKK